MKANKTKEELSQKLSEMVDEFVAGGGEITQVPIGVGAHHAKFHGLVVSSGKSENFGSFTHSQSRPGFHREKILLMKEKDFD
jgi:hypothetical protein|tara:strand:+ start:547 stop:792 length:246 start_codon:yes stop_codon:yes gene_type:complete